MDRLSELAIKWKSDKWGHHNYTPYYSQLLAGREIKTILEIGIGCPTTMCHMGTGYVTGASLLMWQDYYPDAEIFGFDCNPSILINEGNIKCFDCNQGDTDSLNRALFSIGKGFDLVVDDGSHNPEHQILSANVIMPLVNDGGLYVIEDVAEPGRVISGLPKYVCEVAEFNMDLSTRDDRLIVIRK